MLIARRLAYGRSSNLLEVRSAISLRRCRQHTCRPARVATARAHQKAAAGWLLVSYTTLARPNSSILLLPPLAAVSGVIRRRIALASSHERCDLGLGETDATDSRSRFHSHQVTCAATRRTRRRGAIQSRPASGPHISPTLSPSAACATRRPRTAWRSHHRLGGEAPHLKIASTSRNKEKKEKSMNYERY